MFCRVENKVDGIHDIKRHEYGTFPAKAYRLPLPGGALADLNLQATGVVAFSDDVDKLVALGRQRYGEVTGRVQDSGMRGAGRMPPRSFR